MIVALINPTASKGHAAELAHALAGSSPRLRLVLTDAADDVDRLVDSLLVEPAELLVIGGGDGTISNLLTRFDRAGHLDAVPPLLVLPAGHMNTVAQSLVGSRQPVQIAERILDAWTRGVRRLHRMPVLRLSVDDEPIRVGVNCSLGAVARLHRDYRAAHLRGLPGIAEVLARMAMQRVSGDCFEPILGPFEADGSAIPLSAVTAGVISPLPGFMFALRPFPGVRNVSSDGLYTALAQLGQIAIQASLPAILRGRLRTEHMHHGRHHQLSWQNGPRPDLLVVDGEQTVLHAGARVTVAQAATVRIVVWRSMPRVASES